ncbi:hypothetical protein LCGC14_0595910 [marine sediment metagenome]|uniref:Uncharacterized protein n=1 Tax=marine sediment metagenome TaxID=412755 RepID=A0A0F9RVT9_9ZZZZ
MPIKTNELNKNALDEDEKAVFDFLKENTRTVSLSFLSN